LKWKKQFAQDSESNYQYNLLESTQLPPCFIELINKDTNNISLISKLINNICTCRGYNSDIVKNILTLESPCFFKFIFESLNKPELTSDITQLILEVALPIISANKNDTEFADTVNKIFLEYNSYFHSIIRSNSILHTFYGAQLYKSIMDYSPNLLEKELLWDILDVVFKYPFSSALHCLVSQIIVSLFELNRVEIVDMLMNNHHKFIDKLIEEYMNKSTEKIKADFYPHLETIFKSLVKNEYSNNILDQYPKWKEFFEKNREHINSLPGFEGVYKPSEEILRAKEKQLLGIRAGRFTPS